MKKIKPIWWRILFLSVGSLAAVLLMMDILSGITRGLGVISFLGLLLTPALFAVPIIIKKPKLLLVPSVLLPLFIAVIVFKYNDFYEDMFGGKYQHFDYGYAVRDGMLLIRYHGGQYDDTEMIGVETITAPIGTYKTFDYGFPFDTTVEVYWAFDENSNLVGVAVTKETDGF